MGTLIRHRAEQPSAPPPAANRPPALDVPTALDPLPTDPFHFLPPDRLDAAIDGVIATV